MWVGLGTYWGCFIILFNDQGYKKVNGVVRNINQIHEGDQYNFETPFRILNKLYKLMVAITMLNNKEAIK